jgi:dTDP-4-dehydrorhamnose 3,5-epimerase
MSSILKTQTIEGIEVAHLEIPGLILLTPRVFADERGFFCELWHNEKYCAAGMPHSFVQDNFSRSRRGILRGLHIQDPVPQGKLAMVLEGEIFDVAVDLRKDSPTFGRWHGEILSAENKRQMYVPPGCAHGLVALSESVSFFYKCTERYFPKNEKTLQWDDPDIGIDWPIKTPILSARDQHGIRFRDFPPVCVASPSSWNNSKSS